MRKLGPYTPTSNWTQGGTKDAAPEVTVTLTLRQARMIHYLLDAAETLTVELTDGYNKLPKKLGAEILDLIDFAHCVRKLDIPEINNSPE